ncbi:MAG TPA: ABC transporter permease [Anaerolineae bacterium]|nr:ABC transporter permease [Anaerolineae bacterium]HIQ06337.1 ABC transporter permease [Anaerolineae bacterium]
MTAAVHSRQAVLNVLAPVVAVAAALVVGAGLLVLAGVHPFVAFKPLLLGGFSSRYGFTETLVKATPLLLVGLGIAIAFRGGVLNIGAEGQLTVGAIMATAVALALPGLPLWVLLPLTMLTGFVAGALWGGLPGILKARLGVNEILTTIMMNAIALQLSSYLLRGPMIDPKEVAYGTGYPQSAKIPQAAWLPRLVRQTRLHWGIPLALLVAVLVYIFLWRTTIGYRIRAVGANAAASRYAGINVVGYMFLAMVLSGGMAGLAGAVEISGVHHRMLDGVSAGYGFSGIVAALFGKLHPLGIIPASVLFGALLVGADMMQRATGVPAGLVNAMQGLVVMFVVASELWQRRQG